jgi:spore coat protein U domain-containing protein, fimbrial subunit CupE1/2/3/6
MRRVCGAGLSALLLLLGPWVSTITAQGVNCSISSSGVAFGAYSVFASPSTDSTGTVTYSCTLGVSVQIQLSRGSSSTYAPRTMTKGSETLSYNLYLDSNHATIWGDGTGGTSVVSKTLPIGPQTATIYGRITGLQDVSVGTYADSVVATIIS